MKILTGSSDQYMFNEPLLLRKDTHYIWVEVDLEQAYDLEQGEDLKDVTIYAEFLLDDEGNPLQEKEQYEFMDRDITRRFKLLRIRRQNS